MASNIIIATSDNFLLTGTDGNDDLYAPYVNDTMNGGLGDDVLRSYEVVGGRFGTAFEHVGAVTFHMDAGWGHDIILNINSGSETSSQVLEFGPGIKPEDLRLSMGPLFTLQLPEGTEPIRAPYPHLHVLDTKTGDTLDIDAAFDNANGVGPGAIGLIRFADGTELTWQQWINGTPRVRYALGAVGEVVTVKGVLPGDTLAGSASQDILIAAGGTAQINGGWGVDTIDTRQDASANLVHIDWSGSNSADSLLAGSEDTLELVGLTLARAACIAK